MDYEQKYKEALVKAQKELQCCGDFDCDAAKQIFRLFPELSESEDERIRKEILNVVKRFDENSTICGENYNYNKWINWLEKQNERKQIEYDVPNTPIKDSEAVTSRMKYIDENLKPIAEFIIGYANWDLRKDEWNHPVATVPLFRVLDALVQNGKQYSEEHHVVDNNTEPKFKVGDWITNGDYTWKVIDIKPLDYILQSQDGNVVDDTISHVDGNFSSFTIEDAKDGDVLAAGDWVFIFMDFHINGSPKCHCHYDLTLEEFKVDTDSYMAGGGDIYPATKKQRDLLFQKMHEASYEWDAKTKQLIKNNNYDYRK